MRPICPSYHACAVPSFSFLQLRENCHLNGWPLLCALVPSSRAHAPYSVILWSASAGSGSSSQFHTTPPASRHARTRVATLGWEWLQIGQCCQWDRNPQPLSSRASPGGLQFSAQLSPVKLNNRSRSSSGRPRGCPIGKTACDLVCAHIQYQPAPEGAGQPFPHCRPLRHSILPCLTPRASRTRTCLLGPAASQSAPRSAPFIPSPAVCGAGPARQSPLGASLPPTPPSLNATTTAGKITHENTVFAK